MLSILKCLMLVACLIPTVTFGASWYVSLNAGGAANGTSWTDAWTNSDKIVWASITAGDAIYFDGGSSGLSYLGITVGKSGSIASPIQIRPSRDSGRTGLVTISGFGTSSKTNIVVDGSKSDSFQAPTSVTDLRQITNNIGIRFQNTGDLVVYAATRFEGITLRWCEMVGKPPPVPVGWGDTNVMYLNAPIIARDIIEYCWIHWATQYGIGNNGGYVDATSYTNLVVHHCVIENNADDGIVLSIPGVTLHHNILGPKRTDWSAGHQDSVQQYNTVGRWRIYNNVISDPKNSWFWNTFNAAGGLVGNLELYGNLFYVSQGWADRASMNEAAYIAGWSYSGPLYQCTYSNIYVLNNTFYRAPTYSLRIAKFDSGKPAYALTNVWLTNVVLKNNLVLDSGLTEAGNTYGSSVFGLTAPGWLDYTQTNAAWGGMFYTTNDAVLDYNVVHGHVQKIQYGQEWANGEAMAAGTPYVHNTSATPSMVNTNLNDLRLAASDTACKDEGEDLSAFGFPELETDLWGNPRGYNGVWDIGANEYTPSSLLLYLKFQDDLTDGLAYDSSGYGNDGVRFGRCGGTTNFPTSVTVTNGQLSSTGAYFTYYWDGYGTYGRSGDYMGVTNINLGSVSALTVMLWARYDKSRDSGGNLAPWTQDHNASLVDNGQYQVAGAWRLGKENYFTGAVYNNKTKLTIFNGNSQEDRLQMTFWDTCDSNGGSSQMNHYAWVFDHGTNTLYLNGAVAAIEVYSQTTVNLNCATHWLAIGGWPHHGSVSRDPWLTNSVCPTVDEYPNTFWFNGWMDNVRIYSAALTAGDVLVIYHQESDADIRRRIARVANVRVGFINGK